MKYKLGGGILCVLIIILSLVMPLAAQEGGKRYHQHRDAPVKTEDKAGFTGISSHLPLVEIDTGGVVIPGSPAYREDGTYYYTTAADGSENILANMDIIDHETTYNHAGDAPTISTKAEIHVRGHSSRSFDKSSYSLQLVNADGSSNPQPLLGMDAHHEWALHGPYLDKTLMRNYMWYNIGGEIMDYAPNARFCEVILNGEYQGVYVLVEKINAGEDGARLNLEVNAKRNTFSGYLLQMNGHRAPANTEAMTNQFSFYAKRTRYQLDIEFPRRGDLTPEMITEISKDFSDFEKSIYSYDYDHKKYGYAQQTEAESFIDYFLINELTCNYDAGWLSTFIYKDITEKYRMCLWDMNSACDNYRHSQTEPMGFQMQNCLWYVMLFRDEDFTEALVRRYWELRKTYFDPEYLNGYIDDTVEYLGPAIDRNYAVWGYSFAPEEDLLVPTERNPRSYAESIAQMKDFLEKRIAWMDENIESLRQYSAESKVKKFNENAN